MKSEIMSILTIIGAFVVGVVVMILISKFGLNKDKQRASLIIEEAKLKADNSVRQATIDAKTQAYELKLAAEKEIKESKQSITEMENRLTRREDNLNFRDSAILAKENELKQLNDKLTSKHNDLDKMKVELGEKIDRQIVELERVSSMSMVDARNELMEAVKMKMENEVAAYIRDREDDAKRTADEVAKNIIVNSIQRYSQEESVGRTVSVISLPSEEMKGRIIGREGRNIRAIEQATGVDLIIDDTPEVITVSCFDPIRREIARMALETLIKDGRIQPGRIEEVVERSKNDLEKTIQKTGEDAIFKLGISKMDREIVQLVGRLRYRYSYGQNGLEHSMEVAYLAGMMAAELGLNQKLAKRAGLLHDIGKALDFEMEGSHVELGVRVAKKHNENPVVINAIASHHGDVQPTSMISILVAAADTLSAARPGARFESFENYIQRLEQLEAIANSFEGVDQTFAIQAGREVRVMVVPDRVDDLKATQIAREIRERIENEMTYPGQIKVTVIRELRAQELAK